MASALPDLLGALRQPEYTGENRCVPCTVVNAAIAVVLAVAAGVAGARLLWPAAGLGLGSAVLTVSAAAIHLRGYLVPGTPWLTKRYFPDPLLRRFDKAPGEGAAPGGSEQAEANVEALLAAVGAVEECEHEDDLCLTDEFHAAWRERVVALREDGTAREDLAAVLDIDPDGLTIEEHGDAFVAHTESDFLGQWESHAAFLADMAAARELEVRDPEWAERSIGEKNGMLGGLRIFLEQCPACDGPVTLAEETVESCCRSIEVVAVTCDDCGARLMEAEQPG